MKRNPEHALSTTGFLRSSRRGSVERRLRQSGCLGLALVALFGPLTSSAGCVAESGPTRGALVELYTSEGCSSCPPADRQLHRLTAAGPGVVPLALHVDYWDDIGWKDRFAQSAFTRRQQWEVHANAHRTSYTPHFFVNGKEVEDWPEHLAATLRPSSSAAAARITIRAQPIDRQTLHVEVVGTARAAGDQQGPLQLFVVLTESGLASQVDAGENRGARLEHDAVARRWIGPIEVRDGKASLESDITLPSPAAGQVGIVAFIQDATTADVLQAVGTGVCKLT